MKIGMVYGIGFILDCSDESIINFIRNHKEAFCFGNNSNDEGFYEDMVYRFSISENFLDENFDLDDNFESYTCDVSEFNGKGAAISNIMSRETGIRFSLETGDNCFGNKPAILFNEGMPWEYNETEKRLDMDALMVICKKYANELGISDEAIAFHEIQYFE